MSTSVYSKPGNIYFLIFFSCFFFIKSSTAQVLCIHCFNQNEPINASVNNLIINGSFEIDSCPPVLFWNSFCPNSSMYACDLHNWTCIGGGISTYATIFDTTFTVVPDGIQAIYFGNYYCNICSNIQGDTSCIVHRGCTVTGVPPGYPTNTTAYGNDSGISIFQNVSGLIPGNIYVLEFWAGGEENIFDLDGVFAVDVGFGDTLLNCPSTGIADTGRVYVIEFIATSTTHQIKFTNWGHICADCTELILDNIMLYTMTELSSEVPDCTNEISENVFKNEISVSPNPSSQIFNIYFEKQPANVQIEVFNALGENIQAKNFKNISNTAIEIDAISGIYFLKITCENSCSIFRIIKL